MDTLKPEDDYLRGYLTTFTEEYRRKMKIHFPNIDVESRRNKCLGAMKSSPSDFEKLYQEAKIDALSDYIRDDTDSYLGLYSNHATTFEKTNKNSSTHKQKYESTWLFYGSYSSL